MVSGVLVDSDKLVSKGYICKKILRLMIPYTTYLFLDMLLIRKDYSIYMLWGGRAIPGVYWYITCYLFALYILSLSLKIFSERTVKSIILVGGGIAILESNLIDKMPILQYPGVPGDLDVSLLALVYIGVGFFYKKILFELLYMKSKTCDIGAGCIIISFVIVGFLVYKFGNGYYYLDMKTVFYENFFAGLIVPIIAGALLCRITYWLLKTKHISIIIKTLKYCGQISIPIMFMHIPLNYLAGNVNQRYLLYTVIGIGFPALFSLVFNRNKIARILFGIPDFKNMQG